MRAKILLLLFILIGFTAFSQPGVVTTDAEKPYRIEKIFPNPINDYVFVEIEAVDYATARFELLDIMGNRVQQWEPMRIIPGAQRVRLDIKNLHSGVYLFRAKIGDENIVLRVRKV
ncbi:T9SS type A sorting domain-containing protein [Gaoshiqia sediminis]|uniref:T9SS type A sorting domain-containing protein n=1 Tax=Gaoshiqia sediminis TaxID=2986998 RepID=A0AA42C807_9BACT|nr:T9SS type A sorting domain-containing protein [Gaoshiqia sediminis]MCW0484129.1 T9SS type A sorting domain-containing protein [Gaoshiqia sediminis]